MLSKKKKKLINVYMNFYNKAIKIYEKELEDRIKIEKELVEALKKKTITLDYMRRHKIDRVHKKINKTYERELNDKIINENQLQEALNQKYGIMDILYWTLVL